MLQFQDTKLSYPLHCGVTQSILIQVCLHKLAPLAATEITPLQLIIKDDLILSTFSMKIQIFYVDIYLSFILYFPFYKTRSIKITETGVFIQCHEFICWFIWSLLGSFVLFCVCFYSIWGRRVRCYFLFKEFQLSVRLQIHIVCQSYIL